MGDSVNPNHRLQRVLQQNLNAYIDHIITAANDDDRSHSNTTWRPGDAFREVLMEKSHGQIQSLLPADGVSVSKTELWLFNVMYFQVSLLVDQMNLLVYQVSVLVDQVRLLSIR